MYVLVTYDIATRQPEGEARLRRVAKVCKDHGQRVQYSVFECKLDPAQFVNLKAALFGIIDSSTDSIRFYFLGDNWKNRVEHHGAKVPYDIEGPLII